MQRGRVLAKIPLPVGAELFLELLRCFPSYAAVEGHGDEAWVVETILTPQERIKRAIGVNLEDESGDNSAGPAQDEKEQRGDSAK